MPFNKITAADVSFFKSILEEKYVLADEENLARCASDQTEDLHYLPEVVLQPGTTEQVSKILKYCNEQVVPVTARGAGTGGLPQPLWPPCAGADAALPRAWH